ncbi:XRE family transcriptional regulator [Tistrella bauzanensis]|uniref:XRE family transcriptional regulator n=2 Tax=Geminicoccaceae TaxID=2066434 RepID=A0ABU9YMV3_9PROT
MHSQETVSGATERPPILEHVAGNLRRLRRAAGFSQEALAEASGVSRRMLVNIERGDANVSLAVLDRIAAALNVLFVDLVRDADGPDRSRIQALAWAGTTPESRGTLLAGAPASHAAELWIWSLGAGDRYVSEPDGDGWHDMIYVIEGRLTVHLVDGPRVIEAGDFHSFASNQPYIYENTGTARVRFLRNVIY